MKTIVLCEKQGIKTGKKYEKPIIEKMETMMFPFEIISSCAERKGKGGEKIACRQCSSCHSCR